MLFNVLDSDFRPQFAGHETFPLRLLWLKKAYDAVAKDGATRRTFQEQDAIARFGVGRNMAIAIRHWALAAGVLEDGESGFRPTPFGTMVLDDEGYDPYLERPATLWLIHLALAGTPEATTTFFFAFNLLNQAIFDREQILAGLRDLSDAKGSKVTLETLRRDVEVLLRSYVPRGEAAEDAAEPLLKELGLIREQRLANQYEFTRGPKPDLPDAAFALGLVRFWRRWHTNAPTLAAEIVSYAAGSPGRVFKLDEDSVVSRLVRIEQATEGCIVWTDTAGLRQVSMIREPDEAQLIRSCFSQEDRP